MTIVESTQEVPLTVTPDGVTALQAGLDKAPDPELLEWAAQQRRTVVDIDRIEWRRGA